MTKLSVNINKIALLRNSRGRNHPDVCAFAVRCLDLGAHGITLHPRPDQRHARYSDVEALSEICSSRGAELNVEGYPNMELMEVVRRTRPTQCTLVPDASEQLTSDHGWDLRKQGALLHDVIADLKQHGIRISLFVDFDCPDIEVAHQLGADRIELYTEPYANAIGTSHEGEVLTAFEQAALLARSAGLGVNAGHDLNLQNLPRLLKIPGILELSIGHALITECIELGVEQVIRRYLQIIEASSSRRGIQEF